MPIRSPLLLRAAATRIREDRLTELLAVVLQAHPDLARALLFRAGLPASRTVDVSTQVRTRRGKRIDLQLVGLNGSHVACRLWSEHKKGSAYSPGQLSGYATELAEFQGPTALITVVDRLDEAPEDPGWLRLTWREVAVMVDRAGVMDAGFREHLATRSEDSAWLRGHRTALTPRGLPS